jgi:hypothetical protein
MPFGVTWALSQSAGPCTEPASHFATEIAFIISRGVGLHPLGGGCQQELVACCVAVIFEDFSEGLIYCTGPQRPSSRWSKSGHSSGSGSKRE